MRRMCLSMFIVTLAHVCLLGQTGGQEKYRKWLNEEVPYIISSPEKKAFLRLKSDEERDRFIEAFWLRRDPDPDTEENESREEYVERIAHANKNFAFGNAAGWRTDRGRVHILYGRATRIHKTASGEVWQYRHIPGVGSHIEVEFIDLTGNGDLRLLGGLDVLPQ